MKNICSIDIVEALFKPLFTKFDRPEVLSSDNGPQFSSFLTKDVIDKLGIEQRFSTYYAPESQGSVEKWNGTLVSMIRKFIKDDNQKTWDEYIDYVVWMYNCSKQAQTGFSPYEMVFGRKPNLEIDYIVQGLRDANSEYYNSVANQIDRIRSIARERIVENQKYQKDRYDRMHNVKAADELSNGDYVLIKRQRFLPGMTRKLMSPWLGPYKVLRRLNPCNFEIQFGDIRVPYHIRNLRKYFLRKNANEEEWERSQKYQAEADKGGPSRSREGEESGGAETEDSFDFCDLQGESSEAGEGALNRMNLRPRPSGNISQGKQIQTNAGSRGGRSEDHDNNLSKEGVFDGGWFSQAQTRDRSANESYAEGAHSGELKGILKNSPKSSDSVEETFSNIEDKERLARNKSQFMAPSTDESSGSKLYFEEGGQNIGQPSYRITSLEERKAAAADTFLQNRLDNTNKFVQQTHRISEQLQEEIRRDS